MENKGISTKTKIIALAVIAAILGLFAFSKITADKSAGKITVSVVSIDGNTIKEKTIKYYEGDTLIKLVEDNFDNVTITDGFLYTIETLTTPEDWSTFIGLYVNGEMSPVGIAEVQLADGMTVSFVDMEMMW